MSEKILCSIRDKWVIDTPEERVRQEYVNILMMDYGYKKTDIKLEYKTKKSPSDNTKTYPVDIAIFENGKVKVFVENKKDGEKAKNGVKQLSSYMSLNDDVVWGIWTNGSDKFFLKKSSDKSIKIIEVFDIPKKGFNSIESQLRQKNLIISKNLRFVFKGIRAYISGHAIGTNRDEKIASELIKIVLCKTYDEKFTDSDTYLSFYHEQDFYDKTFERIQSIYKDVKKKYSDVFNQNDEIELDTRSLSYCVAQLQRFSLLKANRNVISEAFETIIGYSLKGSQGQFFTPKNVVDLIVNIIKPNKYAKILDPACGSGSFLVESMLFNWEQLDKLELSDLAISEEKRDYAMKSLYGIEKDDFLGKICKSYMAVLGDGKSGIFIANSLESQENWARHGLQLGTFDYVLTNPPFGKEIKLSPDLAKQYITNKIDVAFLERSLDFLKDGGKLAIVLSEVLFHAPSYSQFRSILIYKHNITHIIDLPHDTFRPHNNAKCIALILEKGSKQQETIRMIKISEIGHDHKGNTKYEYDYDQNKYTDKILDDTKNIKNHFLNSPNDPHDDIIDVDSDTVLDKDILVPRFYFNQKISYDTETIEIKELIRQNIILSFDGHGSPESHLKGMGDIPYIRVKDIGNLEIIINPIDSIPYSIAKKMKHQRLNPQVKDVVMVRRGSYRIGDIGFVYQKDIDSIYTKELQFFRVLRDNDYGITSNNLLALLNSSVVKEQIKNMTFIDTTLPTLYKRWENIRLPLYDNQRMNDLDRIISKNFQLREKFWTSFDELNM